MRQSSHPFWCSGLAAWPRQKSTKVEEHQRCRMEDAARLERWVELSVSRPSKRYPSFVRGRTPNKKGSPEGSDPSQRCRGFDMAGVECNDHGTCWRENDKQTLERRQRKLSLLSYNMFDDVVFKIPPYGWRRSWRSRWSNISWENLPEIRGRPTPLNTSSHVLRFRIYLCGSWEPR